MKTNIAEQQFTSSDDWKVYSKMKLKVSKYFVFFFYPLFSKHQRFDTKVISPHQKLYIKLKN